MYLFITCMSCRVANPATKILSNFDTFKKAFEIQKNATNKSVKRTCSRQISVTPW